MTDAELIIDYLLKQIEVGVFYDEIDPKLIADIAGTGVDVIATKAVP